MLGTFAMKKLRVVYDTRIDTARHAIIPDLTHFKNTLDMASTCFGVALASVASWSHINPNWIWALLGSMVLNTFSGIVKSFSIRTFSFKVLFYGVASKVIFLVIPVGVAKVLSFVDLNFHVLLATMFLTLTLNELLSVFSNCYTYRTKVVIDDQDMVSRMYLYFRNYIFKILYKLTPTTRPDRKHKSTTICPQNEDPSKHPKRK